MIFRISLQRRLINQVLLRVSQDLKCSSMCTLIQARKAFSYMLRRCLFRTHRKSDYFQRYLMKFPHISDCKVADSRMRRVRGTVQDLRLSETLRQTFPILSKPQALPLQTKGQTSHSSCQRQSYSSLEGIFFWQSLSFIKLMINLRIRLSLIRYQ